MLLDMRSRMLPDKTRGPCLWLPVCPGFSLKVGPCGMGPPGLDKDEARQGPARRRQPAPRCLCPFVRTDSEVIFAWTSTSMGIAAHAQLLHPRCTVATKMGGCAGPRG